MHGRRFQPGEPLALRAEELNAWQAAAERTRTTQPPRSGERPVIRIPVRNTHDQPIKAFTVAALADSFHDPDDDLSQFLENPAIDIEPFTDDNAGAIPVIVTEYIAAGDIGTATIQGVQAAVIEVTDADHRAARPSKDTDWQLDSAARGGLEIIWKQSGTGTKYAYVLLSGGGGRRGGEKILAYISGAETDGAGKWTYSWTEVEEDPDNHNQYLTVVGGYSSDTDGVAVNSMEAPNDGSAVQGSGVDIDNLPGNFAPVPIGVGAVVDLFGPYGSGETAWWRFCVSTHVDGDDCEAEA